MASYYERPLRSDELYHAWLKKGAKADDHKYIARIPQGKGYRYFYSKSEYQSYLQGEKPKSIQTPASMFKSITSDIQKAGNQAAKEIKKDAKQIADAGRQTFTNYLRNRGSYDELEEGNHPKNYDELPRQKKQLTPEDDALAVNPGRKLDPKLEVATQTLKILDQSMVTKKVCEELTTRYGRLNNCAYCTLAYDMRRRGYDVEASSVSTKTANTSTEIESWYKNAHFQVSGERYSNMSGQEASVEISKELSKQGPGARGQFCVQWIYGGGHSISYEVDDRGDVIYRDCQLNKTMKNEEISDYLSVARVGNILYMRTDDKELSDKALNGVVPKRRKKKK